MIPTLMNNTVGSLLLANQNTLNLVVLGLVFVLLVGIAVSLAKNNQWWRSCVVLMVLAVCANSLYPPSETLRTGIDLRGGTSMLFPVDTSNSQDPDGAIARSLKNWIDRVDPTGTSNIIWRIEGRDRLVVQIPMPSPQIQEARKAYQGIKEKIGETNITSNEIESALALTGEARDKAVNDLLKGIERRKPLIAELILAYDNKQAAEAAYNNAVDEQKKIEAAADRFSRNDTYDLALDILLATNIETAALQEAVAEPEVAIKGSKTETKRSLAIDAFKDRFPDHAGMIDEMATAYKAYEQNRGALDDPNDLIRILRKQGVLEFRIAVTPNLTTGLNIDQLKEKLEKKGPRAFINDPAKWYAVGDSDVESRAGGYINHRDKNGKLYILVLDKPGSRVTQEDRKWRVTGVSQSQTQSGSPAFSFELDTAGGILMSDMTDRHTKHDMAVVLDGEIQSIATIQTTLNTQIQMTKAEGYSPQEIDQMKTILMAGSPEAQLSSEPISTRVIGPTLGASNRDKGIQAAVIALIIVGLFMMVYYFAAGGVANLALAANLVVILGVMAMSRATFTLPGIAGIVLTIGMCVDANVLIFERIRDEMKQGRDVTTALRLGYEKAFSSIIDGNLTNLIVCAVLWYFTSADVKGFATTLGVGILATLFTSLFMTRTIFELWDAKFGIKDMKMLPLVVPALDKLIHPNRQFINKRAIFMTLSAIVLIVSLGLVVSRGEEMLDIEFRAGSEVAFKLKEDGEGANAKQLYMYRGDVSKRVHDVGDWFIKGKADDANADLFTKITNARETRIQQLIDNEISKAAEFGNTVPEEVLAAKRKEFEANTDLSALAGATIQELGEKVNDEAAEFAIRTTVADSKLVAEVATLVFSDKLSTQPALYFEGIKREIPGNEHVMLVTRNTLAEQLGTQFTLSEQQGEINVSTYKGGIAFILRNIGPEATVANMEKRISDMRLQPDFADAQYRDFQIIGLEQSGEVDGEPTYSSAVMFVADRYINGLEMRDAWDRQFVPYEWRLVREALGQPKTLDKVTNFTPTVAQAMRNSAIIALLVSMIAIVAYIWIRFGTLRYGLAAIAALVHDVIIALGAVALAGGILYETPLRDILLIEPFSINMGLIAALLTIIGYSLNDTIVLFDRIRENRGKLSFADGETINRSINQTLSRTMLTSLTTFLAVIVLYILGGEGVRSFAFTLLVGVIAGTYSSIAIASPLLLVGTKGKPVEVEDTPEDNSEVATA